MRLIRPLKPLIKPLLAMSNRGRASIVSNRDANMRHDFSPRYLSSALDASLRRLGFGEVDALLLHSPPADALSDDRIAGALEDLKRAGKVRHYGIACDDSACLRAALTVPGIELLELPLNVMDEAVKSGLADEIRRRRIDVLAREVIRLQPRLDPASAVRHAVARRDAACVIIGALQTRHLEEAVAAAFPATASEYRGGVEGQHRSQGPLTWA
jgi:aryl-alcohol dehydrogenase-like predicted oxidoreductase